jgi:hypothetical protein
MLHCNIIEKSKKIDSLKKVKHAIANNLHSMMGVRICLMSTAATGDIESAYELWKVMEGYRPNKDYYVKFINDEPENITSIQWIPEYINVSIAYGNLNMLKFCLEKAVMTYHPKYNIDKKEINLIELYKSFSNQASELTDGMGKPYPDELKIKRKEIEKYCHDIFVELYLAMDD